MKKSICLFTLTLLFAVSNAFAQVAESVVDDNGQLQRVTEVCGVAFGTSYEAAKEKIVDTFGEPVNAVNNSSIFYRDIDFDGVTFNTVYFMFDSDARASYMSSCMLYVNLETEEEAKEVLKQLYDKLSAKYILTPCEEPEAEIIECYKGGRSPIDDGMGLSLVLGKYLKVGGFGYSILLSYGPYQYVRDDFYP